MANTWKAAAEVTYKWCGAGFGSGLAGRSEGEEGESKLDADRAVNGSKVKPRFRREEKEG